ncbi:hypothetical protein, unknown function [Leishmania tarentolae]|uniref:Uncharacterized protein n=1 Tax=Leishmania tarentolae TaxID=5689 RepID=A0A640KPC4_LEITA|nr:hypothetical protein, unknown function [Leishmania tarentolae]
MPLYIPLGVMSSDDVSARARLERQRILRLNNILRRGNDEQRRQALRMKPLPLPEDPEAVAVPGTAIVDLPNDADSVRGASRGTGAGAFDPLDAVAQRYGGSQYSDEESRATTWGINYSSFMEVLCPNGSSLLESLPLEPRTPPQSLKGSSGVCKKSQFETALSSPKSGLHTRLPSTDVAAAAPDASLSLGRNACVTHAPPSVSFASTSTLSGASAQLASDETYVDAPVTLSSEAASLRAHSVENVLATPLHSISDPASDATRATAATHVNDEDPTSDIFVSAGSFSLAASNRSGRWHSLLQFRRSLSGLSKTSRTDSVRGRRSSSSVANPSPTHSLSQRALQSPSELSWPTSGATSALLTPLTMADGCDLGGRVIFTDRFVRAQSHTALPTMISAFKQYMRSAPTTTLSLPLTHSHTNIYTPYENRPFPPQQKLQSAHQKPNRYHLGVPLRLDNTNKEMENCLAEACQCLRPTFRRIDPADVYGTSHYISGAFIKVKESSTST